MPASGTSGLSPEYVQFNERRGVPHYLLRLQSMFILNQITWDPVYRELGWEILQVIEKYCKTKYECKDGELANAQDTVGVHWNKMESFFLAETMLISCIATRSRY
jgi:Glycosyl hydrolase family 47